MTNDQPLLVIDKLKCVRDARVLFSQLSLRLEPAEVISLQGANGAGKSTLLRCIANLYPDYEGEVRSTPFVYAGHKAGLCGQLTTTENLQFLSGLDTSADNRDVFLDAPIMATVEDALAAVGLAGYETMLCAALSAGQLRRVGLARLLLSRAPLWLLDEPLTALDSSGVDLLGRVLKRHVELGGGAICATHQNLPFEGCMKVELTAAGAVSVAA